MQRERSTRQFFARALVVTSALLSAAALAAAAHAQDSAPGLEPRSLSLSPVHFEFLPGLGATGIAVAGDRAYVTSIAGLRAYDISEITKPRQIGLFEIANNTDVKVEGHYAYLSSGLMYDDFGHLTVVDISNPERMKQLGRVEVPHGSISVEVQGPYAYLGGYDAGLFVVDTSMKDAPELVATATFPRPENQNVHIFPVNLWAAKQRLLGKAEQFPYRVGRVWWSTIDGPYAYVCDEGTFLHILDIRDPRHPKPLSHFIHRYKTGTEYSEHACNDVAVEGDVAVVAMDHGGIGFFDISDKSQPKTTAYVEIWKQATREIVDAKQVRKEARSHNEWRFSPGHTTTVLAEDGFAYAAAGDDGLYVFDFQNPRHPEAVFHYPLQEGAGTSWGITKRGNHLFVTYAGFDPGYNEPNGRGGWGILEIVAR